MILSEYALNRDGVSQEQRDIAENQIIAKIQAEIAKPQYDGLTDAAIAELLMMDYIISERVVQRYEQVPLSEGEIPEGYDPNLEMGGAPEFKTVPVKDENGNDVYDTFIDQIECVPIYMGLINKEPYAANIITAEDITLIKQKGN
jgi:hypothetical protein